MSKYDINFKKFALLLLPTFLRKPVFAAITCAIASQLNYLNTRFVWFRNDSNYRLEHNGQVCYLIAMLNDAFDMGPRRITVTDQAQNGYRTIIHLREENMDIPLPLRESQSPIIINRRGTDDIHGFDFWINIPQSLRSKVDDKRVKALVKSYKLASKRYETNYV